MKNFNAGECWLFNEGLAAVNIKNKWGYIDREGRVVIEPQYTHAFGFTEGLAAVEVDGKYGFINKDGRLVIPPKYYWANSFTEGLATVQADDSYQIIDRDGAVVVTLDKAFTDVQVFSCGLAAVEVNSKKYGFIDTTGKMVIEPMFGFVTPFSDGLAIATIAEDEDEDEEDERDKKVKEEPKIGIIDTKGRFVMAPRYDEVENYSEGVMPVKKDGRWRFVDNTGADAVLLREDFEYVYPLIEGRAIVLIGGKFGAIDKAGNLIIDARFDNLCVFSDGLAYARTGNTHGFINTSGNFEFQKPVPKPTLMDILKGQKSHLRW